ncbi:MAG TPA: hypothetical protein VJ890_04900 [Vineibacter sp.]|nr:hypothetical protein [Vineibacter sp.]
MVTKTSENGLVLERSARPPDAFLADFDIDGHSLKTDHIAWLDEHIVRRDKAKSGIGGRWKVWLTGRASRSGGASHNYQLSERRIEAVERFLAGRMMPDRYTVVPVPMGEGAPIDAGIFENEMDRSVHVEAEFTAWGKPSRKRRHLIPNIKPWRRFNKQVLDFTIQVHKAQVEVFAPGFLPIRKGSLDVKLFVEVRELGTGDTALYEYVGTGVFSSLAPPGPTAGYWRTMFENGSKHRFATERPMDAEDFGAKASLKIDKPRNGIADSYIFGPQEGFFSDTKVKVKDLTLGKNDDLPTKVPKEIQAGGGLAFGDMKLVTTRPSWAN